MTDYVVYDVFTDRAFGGNPLAVIPDASGLSEDQLLPIAREFGFSETTFVFPPRDPAHTARVRIFTPGLELAFAGHPTVGTAVALADLGQPDTQVLELGVGPIPVQVSDRYARFVTRVPLSTSDGPSTGEVAACLRLSEAQIRTLRHRPVFASLGTEFLLVELTDQRALDASAPVVAEFRRAAGDDAERLAIFAYVDMDDDAYAARMFQPLGGIMEDPATGSAAAAFAAFVGRQEGTSRNLTITQGVQMGRPSRIDAEVIVEAGQTTAVAIGGSAVRVMEGRLHL